MMNSFLRNILLTVVLWVTASAQGQSDFKKETMYKIRGSKELPIELNLILDSYQQIFYKDILKARTAKILPIALSIDSYARTLNKEDIFIIGKIEIYKTLLKIKYRDTKAIINGDSLEILHRSIDKSTDPFIKWFLQALLVDCENLLASSQFKNYLLQKNSGKLDSADYRKIDKKVQLLYRWISILNPDALDYQSIIKIELLPFMYESLQNIEQAFFIMASSTQLESKPVLIQSPSEFKFFSLVEFDPTPKETKKPKTVDDILSPITNEGGSDQITPKLPKPSQEDWINDDNAPTSLKNLPKPQDDADWLEDI